MERSPPGCWGRIRSMRTVNFAFATLVASLAIACGQGVPATATSQTGAPGPGTLSTMGMFLSRTSTFSHKDGDALGKGCDADVKKACGTLKSGDGYVRRLMHCLRT